MSLCLTIIIVTLFQCMNVYQILNDCGMQSLFTYRVLIDSVYPPVREFSKIWFHCWWVNSNWCNRAIYVLTVWKPSYIITVNVVYFQDECAEVRTMFIQKLHKGLMSLRLPLQYLSIMCLAANESDKSRRNVVKQMLTANINRRREYLRQNSVANSQHSYYS